MGVGRYVDDIDRPSILHAVFVRSPFSSARILDVDVSEALAVEGVETVLTGKDLAALPSLHGVMHHPWFVETEQPLLAKDVVRFAGEPVAVVLATSPYVAEDGAEAVFVDYEPLQPVVELDEALAADAPLVHEEAGTNVVVDREVVDDDLEAAFASAAAIVDTTFSFARITAMPMEARACLAEWDDRDERLVVFSSTQIPHLLRTTIARILSMAESSVRVIAPDVGGGFGQKAAMMREDLVVAEAARRLCRPVKWIEDRLENFVSAPQGHEQRHSVKAAFGPDGALLGLDAELLCNVGSYSFYPFSYGLEPMMAAGELPGTYKVPRAHIRTRGVVTNKPPTVPYRGVSRPQAVFIMERLMERAAHALGISPMEVRRRNLIADEDFPYKGITGVVYDRGSYRQSLEKCLEALDHEGFARRKEEARQQGRLLGLGVACFSESTGFGTRTFAARNLPITPGYESARLEMDPGGIVTVAVGASAHGQGHKTTLAQVVADELDLPFDQIRVLEGDTDRTPYGWGTFASRSMVAAGGASKRAAGRLREKILRIAAHMLEAEVDDLTIRAGKVHIKGAEDRFVEVADVAFTAYHAAQNLPEGEEAGLYSEASFDPPGTYSNATHGAIVEVDRDTGEVRIERYVVVEDCGTVINPMIVDGQVMGGVAQGIGKALYEQIVYDSQGQCQTASLMDYLVPTASEIPTIEISHLATPNPHTETGAKGMGEGGLIGAPAALANAVSDALQHLGIEMDAVPMTPELVLEAIENA